MVYESSTEDGVVMLIKDNLDTDEIENRLVRCVCCGDPIYISSIWKELYIGDGIALIHRDCYRDLVNMLPSPQDDREE